MKLLVILLFSLPLLAFEGKKLYQCTLMYRVIDGAPHEFSPEEQEKSRFGLVFSKDLSRLKTSEGLIYTSTKTSVKGKLYVKKVVVNGRTLYYKLKVANKSGLYKSVSVTGYGNLVNEYVLCQKAKMNSSKKVNEIKSKIG